MEIEQYSCKSCKHGLFLDFSVRPHKSKTCSGIYTELLLWMSKLIDYSGIIECPNCQSNVGNYNWKPVDCTTCNKSYEPAFCFSLDCIEIIKLPINYVDDY